MGRGSGVVVRYGVCHRLSSDPEPQWLGCRSEAVTPIQPLAWELPYAASEALKSKQANKQPPPRNPINAILRKKKKGEKIAQLVAWFWHWNCIYLRASYRRKGLKLDNSLSSILMMFSCSVTWAGIAPSFNPISSTCWCL